MADKIDPRLDSEEIRKRFVGKVTDDSDGVRVDRATKFGNPFRLKKDGGDWTRRQSIHLYKGWLRKKIYEDEEFREEVRELAGENLLCWCSKSGEIGKKCHAQVLARCAINLTHKE